jgi:hypothetical protein
MQEKNRRLPVIRDTVVKGVTCFSVQAKYGVDCQRSGCRYWLEHAPSHNCVLLAAKDGPRTLEEIGQMYGLTRMRICQIEKGIYSKIRKSVG